MRINYIVVVFILIIGCSPKSDLSEKQTEESVETNYPKSKYEDFTDAQAFEAHKIAMEENWTNDFTKWADRGLPTRYLYLHFSEFWPHTVIKRSKDKLVMPVQNRQEVANFSFKIHDKTYSLEEYVNTGPVNGIIIVNKGKIVFEQYPRMLATDKHVYMSVSKTFIGILVGILEDRGLIDVNEPIEKYLKKLSGSHIGSIPIIDFLDYSCGFNCTDDLNPEACLGKLWHSIGWPNHDNALEDPLEYVNTLKAERKSGQVWEYGDINPLMLTFLVEEVSGMKYSDLLEQEIWQKLGSETDALLMNAAYGRSATPLGFSSTLRDMARFGMMFVPSGRKSKNPIISDRLLNAIQNGGRPEIIAHPESRYWFSDNQNGPIVLDGDTVNHSTYLWEIVMKDGDFFKSGFGGIGLYISPRNDLVIAYFGSAEEKWAWNGLYAISRKLAKTRLFE